MVIQIALGICLAVVILVLGFALLGQLFEETTRLVDAWETWLRRHMGILDLGFTAFMLLVGVAVIVAWLIAAAGADQPQGWAVALAFLGTMALVYWLIASRGAGIRRLFQRLRESRQPSATGQASRAIKKASEEHLSRGHRKTNSQEKLKKIH